jgi:hypothetical protein
VSRSTRQRLPRFRSDDATCRGATQARRVGTPHLFVVGHAVERRPKDGRVVVDRQIIQAPVGTRLLEFCAAVPRRVAADSGQNGPDGCLIALMFGATPDRH